MHSPTKTRRTSDNFNNIDLMRAAGYRFTAAVALLEHWLERHESR